MNTYLSLLYRGRVANVLDRAGTEFEPQLRYYDHFWTNTLRKGMNPLRVQTRLRCLKIDLVSHSAPGAGRGLDNYIEVSLILTVYPYFWFYATIKLILIDDCLYSSEILP